MTCTLPLPCSHVVGPVHAPGPLAVPERIASTTPFKKGSKNTATVGASHWRQAQRGGGKLAGEGGAVSGGALAGGGHGAGGGGGGGRGAAAGSAAAAAAARRGGAPRQDRREGEGEPRHADRW